MPIYKFVAKDQAAHQVMGKIMADHAESVRQELRKRKLTIISIDLLRESQLARLAFWKRIVAVDELAVFSRQLATMLSAGIPISECLDVLQRQIQHPFFQGIVVQLRDDIQAGSSLSSAFAKHPNVFDEVYVHMIKVGESGGVLSHILDRTAAYLERSVVLKRNIQSALIYPGVVLGIVLIISGILLIKIVPIFSSIYETFDAPLPIITQRLIRVSQFLQKFYGMILGGGFLTGFLFFQYRKSDAGELLIDRMLLGLPIVGPLIKKIAISRFIRTLATLLQNDVPIIDALNVVAKTSGNRVIQELLEHARLSLAQGESLSVPLERVEFFPPLVTRMIAVGEKSGQLDQQLLRVADFYDDEVQAAVSVLTRVMEPLMIVVLGGIVGFIVVALFSPIMGIARLVH